MPGLVPGIHVFAKAQASKTWMAGTKPGHDGKLQRLLLVAAFLAGEFYPRDAFFGRNAIWRAAFAADRFDAGIALLDDKGLLRHGFADQPFRLFTHRLLRHPSAPVLKSTAEAVLSQSDEISTGDTKKEALHDPLITARMRLYPPGNGPEIRRRLQLSGPVVARSA
jgi:hypothetical protein